MQTTMVTDIDKKYNAIKDCVAANWFTGSHQIHTPRALVEEILSQIPDLSNNKTVLVLFNLEFIISLVYTTGVNTSNITFYSDHENKTKLARRIGVNVIETLENNNMKFDVVVGNPPFSEKSKASDKLWAKFIVVSMNLIRNDGIIAFITPSGWTSSTNMAYPILRNKIMVANFSGAVSKFFGGTGGTQRFTYFIASDKITNIVPTCIFDEGKICLDPTETPFAPQKSSSGYAYSIAKKMFESQTPVHSWERIDHSDGTKAVVLPMAKSANYIVKYEDDSFDGSRYKLKYTATKGEIIAHNLNLKLYRNLRWVLRSGPALAGNFKLLPIPETKMTDAELYAHFGLTQEEIDYIEAHVK